MRYLLTGCSGCGKTMWLSALIAQAPEFGIEPAGILSPAVFSEGSKTGIDCLMLPQNKRITLSVHRDKEDAPHDGSKLNLLWKFFPESFAEVNSHLRSLLQNEGDNQYKLLLVDEIGPIEFYEGGGLFEAFPLIESDLFQNAIITVRPQMIEDALIRWPGSQVLETNISPESFLASLKS